jgi:hypothetical protein
MAQAPPAAAIAARGRDRILPTTERGRPALREVGPPAAALAAERTHHRAQHLDGRDAPRGRAADAHRHRRLALGLGRKHDHIRPARRARLVDECGQVAPAHARHPPRKHPQPGHILGRVGRRRPAAHRQIAAQLRDLGLQRAPLLDERAHPLGHIRDRRAQRRRDLGKAPILPAQMLERGLPRQRLDPPHPGR